MEATYVSDSRPGEDQLRERVRQMPTERLEGAAALLGSPLQRGLLRLSTHGGGLAWAATVWGWLWFDKRAYATDPRLVVAALSAATVLTAWFASWLVLHQQVGPVLRLHAIVAAELARRQG